MKTTSLVLATAMALSMSIGLPGAAEARDARGAYVTNSSGPDPTVPRHKHGEVFSSRRATKEQACCVWNPKISAVGCEECGRERRYDPATGKLLPRVHYRSR